MPELLLFIDPDDSMNVEQLATELARRLDTATQRILVRISRNRLLIQWPDFTFTLTPESGQDVADESRSFARLYGQSFAARDRVERSASRLRLTSDPDPGFVHSTDQSLIIDAVRGLAHVYPFDVDSQTFLDADFEP